MHDSIKISLKAEAWIIFGSHYNFTAPRYEVSSLSGNVFLWNIFLRFYLNNDGKFIELSWKILSQKKLRKKAENAAKWTSRYQEEKNEITYWICFFYYLLFFIWDTAGYATTRFPSGGMKHNNKQQSRVKNRQGKHSDSKLMSAWNSCEIFRNILFDFNFIHHRSETHKKNVNSSFSIPSSPPCARRRAACARDRNIIYYASCRDVLKYISKPPAPPKTADPFGVNKQLTSCATDEWVIENIFAGTIRLQSLFHGQKYFLCFCNVW